MRKVKTFKIEGYDQTFEIRELKVKEILDLFQKADTALADLNSFRQVFINEILERCTNIKFEDLLEMSPSEVEEIWNQFREVNKAFFDLAHKMGLTELLEQIQKAIIKDLSQLFVSLSKQGTGRQS